MILKSFDFQCDFDFPITTSEIIFILNHLYLGDLILILKSSTYINFAHLWPQVFVGYGHNYILITKKKSSCILEFRLKTLFGDRIDVSKRNHVFLRLFYIIYESE